MEGKVVERGRKNFTSRMQRTLSYAPMESPAYNTGDIKWTLILLINAL